MDCTAFLKTEVRATFQHQRSKKDGFLDRCSGPRNSRSNAASATFAGSRLVGVLFLQATRNFYSFLMFSLLIYYRGLSDIDMDGRLSCDEFVLAMHLCDLVRAGEKLPDVLPQELVPPNFRRPSIPATAVAGSLVSPKGASTPESIVQGSIVTSPSPSEEMKVMSPVSFEDKRKENFDKGIIDFENETR